MPSNLPIATADLCMIPFAMVLYCIGNFVPFILIRGIHLSVVHTFAKLDSIGMEYTYLLATQPESHRPYFDDKLAAAADKALTALKKAEKI
ncbi:hypothetical protein V1508DRAFT_280129 [Lipomyces doorenjongii]|uniref:uncharacterized protein n=1 Tax=Lipomyces doorenjongii TaxID=383834 RepID=UPI0034CE7A03